ncbi:hypothetical protein MGAD_38520 [Mycolicibacterium gadium]|jgi:hypothetical protein|uniref:Uncharacterized protein n=1 Tax=Mycolicibacterium gadium TaxID=1794 RepID=A0A7I7WS30_MYCGU|nr:hypothetical protein MGAD_38520 [Mycolicibacterium gadium]
MLIASSTAIIATATNVTDPDSALTRFHRGDGAAGDDDPRKENRLRRDGRDDVGTVSTKAHRSALGRDGSGGIRAVVATRCQACGLPGRVDAPDVHSNCGETRCAQQQHRDQARNPERRFDRGTADLAA